MNLDRVRREVADAQRTFAAVECYPTETGGLSVLTALQTTQGNVYTLAIAFPEAYPNTMPTVHVRRPALRSNSPHRYNSGNICYLHPTMWNPGLHNLTFVIARTAKWLNKYDLWVRNGRWPGAEILH